MIVILFSLIGAKRLTPSRAEMGEDEYPDMREIWAYGKGKTKVVIIPISGAIFMEDDDGLFFKSNTASVALKSIRRATNDPKVKALLLSINSGGGGITASDMIYKALLDFKAKDKNRKIVALFGDIAASGAYYIAMAADYIVAHPTSITGSIGVLMQTINIKGLGEKIGVKSVVIKSGRNKDILNPFEDLSEEQRNLLQSVIDELYERFVNVVSNGRHLSPEAIREIADGRIFTSSTALKLSLIDSIGYEKDAINKLTEMLGVTEVSVYRYEERISWFSFLRNWQHGFEPGALIPLHTPARFLYLWQP
jgi:protease-4